jgi:RNA polymerase sigma factor (sigma-70 family)
MGQEDQSLAGIIRKCLEKSDAREWAELIRRLQPILARVAYRVACEWGITNASETDDILQEAFLKIGAHGGELLRRLPLHDETASLAYLKVTAANCARDYLRAKYAEKRGQDVTIRTDSRIDELVPGAGAGLLDKQILLQQINLALVAPPRDRNIFWMYYLRGFTAHEIAAIPEFGLTQKGVESLLFRHAASVRKALSASAGVREESENPSESRHKVQSDDLRR